MKKLLLCGNTGQGPLELLKQAEEPDFIKGHFKIQFSSTAQKNITLGTNMIYRYR